MKSTRLPFIFLLILVSIISCTKDDQTPKPKILGFTPESGVVGTTVTITGKNFNKTAADNILKFNGIQAVIAEATKTRLIATVPAGVTTGKITVEVNGKTTTSTNDFVIIQPVTITSFTPEHALPGNSIIITGTNFSTTLASNTVTFNGIAAEVTAATATQLVVTVPATATTGKISVTISSLAATSVNDFEVLKDFPRTGLMGYWPFTGNGEEKGLNPPAVHNFNFLDVSTAPTFTTDRYGKTAQAISFDGTEYTNCGAKVIPNRPWTISVWLDPGEFNNPTIGFMDAASGHEIFFFNFYNNLSGDFFITARGEAGTEEDPGPNYDLVSGTPTKYIPGAGTDNTWMLITMTYDGAVFKVYKNNTEAYTNTVATQTPTPGFFRLGRSLGAGAYNYIGNMDDLIVYNRVLTAQELTQLYQQTVSKY